MEGPGLEPIPLPPIDIILVNTRHAGNIGSTARIMKNMGFNSLILVNPTSRAGLEAVRMARGAEDLLESAVVVNSLEEALSRAKRAYAVTRRPRKISKNVLTPAQCVKEISSCGERTALVFGSEKLGLSGDEIALCGALIQIPAAEASPSLNLAQAVAVTLYETRRYGVPQGLKAPAKKEDGPADIKERTILYKEVEDALGLAGFFKSENHAHVMARITGVIERSNPETKEVNTLIGAFKEIKRALTK